MLDGYGLSRDQDMTSTPTHASKHHENPCTHDLFPVPKTVYLHFTNKTWQPLKVDLHSLCPQRTLTRQRLRIRVNGMSVMKTSLQSSVVQRGDILMVEHVSKMVGNHGVV